MQCVFLSLQVSLFRYHRKNSLVVKYFSSVTSSLLPLCDHTCHVHHSMSENTLPSKNVTPVPDSMICCRC